MPQGRACSNHNGRCVKCKGSHGPYSAFVCSSCDKGCVVCGTSSGSCAYLCGSCNSNIGKHCVKCGKSL